MANTAYTGAGTTLSSNYYMRSFYVSNRDAQSSSSRKSISNTSLSFADGMALRRAIKSLGGSDFSETQDTSIRNSVLAYIQTYNHTLSSSSASSDYQITRDAKHLKSVTNEYADELDKIGITVNEDGTLTSRDALFKTASLSKFQALFSSDSDYMQRVSSYAKRIERRGEALELSEKNQKIKEIAANKAADTTANTAAATAQIVAASMDLDTLLNTGIGKNVNVIL